ETVFPARHAGLGTLHHHDMVRRADLDDVAQQRNQQQKDNRRNQPGHGGAHRPQGGLTQAGNDVHYPVTNATHEVADGTHEIPGGCHYSVSFSSTGATTRSLPRLPVIRTLSPLATIFSARVTAYRSAVICPRAMRTRPVSPG